MSVIPDVCHKKMVLGRQAVNKNGRMNEIVMGFSYLTANHRSVKCRTSKIYIGQNKTWQSGPENSLFYTKQVEMTSG